MVRSGEDAAARYECRPIPRHYARKGLSSFFVGLSCALLVSLAGVTALRSQPSILFYVAPLGILAAALLLAPWIRLWRARRLRYMVTDLGLAIVDTQGRVQTFGFEALDLARIERHDDGSGDLELCIREDALGFREEADKGFYGVPDIDRFLDEARAAWRTGAASEPVELQRTA